MNYFPFDPCPQASAIALDDKRLARVFHEAVMTLSKAQFMQTGQNGPYSPRVPIPRALIDWVTGEGERWFVAWTRHMLGALIERNGSARVGGYACFRAYCNLQARFKLVDDPLPQPATFPNLARAAVKGLDYSSMDDTHAAYRGYMLAQWQVIDKRPCSWTHHGPPMWARSDLDSFLSTL